MSDPRYAMVVDDHPTNRLLATALLKKLGWTVVEAENGDLALTKANETPQLKLVLLDISMPGLSGEETCTRLRAADKSPPLRIIAYTAHAFPEDLERLLATGFDDVLIKPIGLQRLQELIANL